MYGKMKTNCAMDCDLDRPEETPIDPIPMEIDEHLLKSYGFGVKEPFPLAPGAYDPKGSPISKTTYLTRPVLGHNSAPF